VWLGGSPITQPRLSLGSFRAGTAPRIHIEAQSFLPYVLYSASDLRDWTPLYTNFTGGPTDFTDAHGSNRSCRFYRAGVLSQDGWTKLTVVPVTGVAAGTNYYTNALPPAGGNLRLSTP
jgi:hypothetical protein